MATQTNRCFPTHPTPHPQDSLLRRIFEHDTYLLKRWRIAWDRMLLKYRLIEVNNDKTSEILQ